MSPAPDKRKRLLALVRVLLTLGILAWLARRIDLEQARAVLATAPWWAFVLPGVLMVTNSALHSWRLVILMRAVQARVSFPQALSALLRASFLGLALPSGGSDLAKAGFLGQASGRLDRAGVALTASRVQDLLPWAGLLIFGLLWGLPEHDPALALVAGGFSAVFLTVPALAWWASGRDIPVSGRWTRWLAGAAEAVRRLRSQPRAIVASLALALPFAFINAFVAWAVIRAYGVELPLVDALALVPAADAVISLPITVSGLGVREGVFEHLLRPYGAPVELAVAVGLTRWTGELTRAGLGGLLFLLQSPSGPSGASSTPEEPRDAPNTGSPSPST